MHLRLQMLAIACLSCVMAIHSKGLNAEENEGGIFASKSDHQHTTSEKLIIVTLDGLRWQEVFMGADSVLVNDLDLVTNIPRLRDEFVAAVPAQRAIQLMPFFHQVLKQQGFLIGNPTQNQDVRLSNDYYFSYPGYIEIYTGKVDPNIRSNAKIEASTPNILEQLQNKHQYPNKIGFFGSWDVFPYILRRGKHDVVINAGFETLQAPHTDTWPSAEKDYLQKLNQVFDNTPSPWQTVRLDAFTHAYAMAYLQHVKPPVLAISYGDTDDFAHDGDYEQYLRAAHRADKMIAQLWQFIQQDPYYKDQTHLLITTDHGRGSHKDDWQHHASQKATQGYMKSLSHFAQGIVGSDKVWIAGIGPNIKASPTASFEKITLNQFAPTALVLLKECELASALAKPIIEILEHNPCD